MPKPTLRQSILNLSVEEENLAGVPFAVLERRVGKKVGKIEIKGNKTLPDGSEVEVTWQIQGNNELGLPTEQDLDIFVALGVLTFRSNFSKTITFTGREIARILDITAVHGKLYRRIKLAMDRFIPLRFRALTASDEQEEVKWLNVFQEASFSLDRTSGRCTGSVTWTDKLIQSMDSGFFRLIDAGRYMELDGITAKHLYRYLAVAFEKTDLLVIDARKLATENLGIVNIPQYLSRLMQTLEPAFDQLTKSRVLGSYHIVSAEDWRIALHRDASYVPERKALSQRGAASAADVQVLVRAALEKVGIANADAYVEQWHTEPDLYQLQRGARLIEEMKHQEVAANVAVAAVRKCFDEGPASPAGRDGLDWCEIAIETCRRKSEAGQVLRNLPGLLVKIARHPEGRNRLVHPDQAASWIQRFRNREEAVFRQQVEAEERELIVEYEQFRQKLALSLFEEMPEPKRHALRREKAESVRNDQRFQRLTPEMKQRELDELILQHLARRQAPSYEKWLLRRRAGQAVLPFMGEVLSRS